MLTDNEKFVQYLARKIIEKQTLMAVVADEETCLPDKCSLPLVEATLSGALVAYLNIFLRFASIPENCL